MHQCKGCKNTVEKGRLMRCNGCGETYCEPCANKTKKICPKCYYDIEIIG